MKQCIYKSPVGNLLLTSDGPFITGCSYTNESTVQDADDPALSLCVKELDGYFNETLKNFTVPVKPNGTDFQKRVWRALMAIPYGKTVSYKQLAALSGNQKACRAVGGANNKNPIVIIIPCHRVVGSDNSLTGYGGGLEVKQFLLELEGAL